jgi:CRISPR/Cas system-associated exonuclease Cas4 (RecB family)
MSYSPSKLGKLKLCPKFDYKPVEDEEDQDSVTARGTLLHEAYATGTMAGLTPAEVGFIEAAITMTEAEAAALPQPVRILSELKVCYTPLKLPGTADKVIISGDYAKVKDLKTGPAGLPDDADDSVQVLAYILGVYEAFPEVMRCDGDLLNPRTREDSEIIVTIRDDIPTIHAKLKAIIDDRENQFAKPRPGSHCRDCKYIAQCHEFAPMVKTVATSVFPLLPAVFDSTVDLDPVEMALIGVVRLNLEAWCKAVKERANASGITPPGFKRINKDLPPSLPKENRAAAMRVLREKLGMSQDTIDACVRPTFGDLIEALTLTGLGKDAAKSRVYEALAELTTTGTTTYLQRDKKSLSDGDIAAMLMGQSIPLVFGTSKGGTSAVIETTAV